MSELREQLAQLGFQDVKTYINSGNIFFKSEHPRETIVTNLQEFFAQTYPFIASFSLIEREEYLSEYNHLPTWWSEDLARKDVLFFTEGMDKEAVMTRVNAFSLHDEIVYFGQLGIYWGKYTEAEYLKTSYHKQLLKEDFYRQITIRNGKTAEKILEFLTE